jgi:hypothetical protein
MNIYTINLNADDKELIVKTRVELSVQQHMLYFPSIEPTPTLTVALGNTWIIIPPSEPGKPTYGDLQVPIKSTDADYAFLQNLGISLAAVGVSSTGIDFLDNVHLRVNVLIDDVEHIQKYVLFDDEAIAGIQNYKDTYACALEITGEKYIEHYSVGIGNSYFVLKPDLIHEGTMILNAPIGAELFKNDDYCKLLSNVISMGAQRVLLVFEEKKIELIPVRLFPID